MLTKLLRTIRERREAREEEQAALEAVAHLRELARREAEGPAAGALRRGSYARCRWKLWGMPLRLARSEKVA